MKSGCRDGSLTVMFLTKSFHRFERRGFAALLLVCFFLAAKPVAHAQDTREDEIVANLAGGRAIIHVTNDLIIFAAIDQPIEKNSVPPRVVDLDTTHIGILFGASEWRIPADPRPVRLDRDFQRVGRGDPRYQFSPDEGEPDLESIGIGFLEKLRPLVEQLHHKLDYPPDEPIFQVVVVGYAPKLYGPEVWVIEFRIEQELIATRGDFWQTRIQRPRFAQLYPPEKHERKTIVESRFPTEMKGATLTELVQGNDPNIIHVGSGQPRFSKVLDRLHEGQAQKAVPADSVDFMKAVLPLISGGGKYILGTMEERQGFTWVIPPDEPVEKVQEDKNRPPGAPSLRGPIKP